jgi:predicted ATPase/class 3 adenylate cyclase
MSGLPTGTVTLLFTDIEGSTRLLRRLGDRYAEVLGRHDRVVRAACARHGGREVNTQGDAFFVAFERARDAVAAAVQVQRALAAEQWPEGAGVRVRMGLHTGEPVVGAANYVGLAVHRAARICALGHGGQILLSSATRELLEDELRPGISFRDLGQWRLKDFDRPERLFQVVVGDLPAEFPPPVSVAVSHQDSGGVDGAQLPPSPNRTIGREDDVRAIANHLGASGVRLLTLTGPGGVGKTRLAVEAGRAVEVDFPDGARFVSLAALRRAEDVPSALVQALAIVPDAGENSEQAIARFLSAKDLLLVLDNVEHLLPAARVVSDLLIACATLTVLATSREPLALQAERCYPVAPLALPGSGAAGDLEAMGGVDAIALFCERARAHDPGFRLGAENAAAIAEICRRVDGLPLAIELAAARCGLLSATEIAQRLDAALVTHGAGAQDSPARHQTLRATIDWSHDLLNGQEKACFARFAAFAGGATIEAAETITHAGLATLDRLVAKSLLVRRQHDGAPTRLGMLETIRAQATERLAAAADRDAIFERHYQFFLAMAQRDGTERALCGADGEEHLSRLDAEIDNLHAAVAWALGRPDAEPALSMCAALDLYWRMRYRHADAIEAVDRALSLPGADAHPRLRIRALCSKARALWAFGRGAEQLAALVEAEADARALADPLILSETLQVRASYEGMGRIDVAEAFANEALDLATAADDAWTIAMAHRELAVTASTIADLRERADRAVALLEEVGNVYYVVNVLVSAAYSALCMASDRDAKEFVERATPATRARNDPLGWMLLRGNFALAALFTGDVDAADDAFREELGLCRELAAVRFVCEGLSGLAAVAVIRGDNHRAARLAGAADAHRYGEPEDAVDRRLGAAFLRPARTRHGADAWDTAARDGHTLSFEGAIAYALEELRAHSRTHEPVT